MSRAVSVTIALLFAVCGSARQLPTDESAPLVLVRIIPIPGVVGRFDHMAVDNNGGRVFAAVHGNDSVEVVDTTCGRRDGSVKEGFIKPQMVAYLPDLNRIVVSNEGDGSCKILDANTYQLIDMVKFSDDADQLRYDPATKRVYVGYGDGAIGVLDATTNKKIGGDFEVGAHPESFQLEEKGPSCRASIIPCIITPSNFFTIRANRSIPEKINAKDSNFNGEKCKPHRRREATPK